MIFENPGKNPEPELQTPGISLFDALAGVATEGAIRVMMIDAVRAGIAYDEAIHGNPAMPIEKIAYLRGDWLSKSRAVIAILDAS